MASPDQVNEMERMTDLTANYVDPARVRHYVEKGPPAFAPGHGGMLQMVAVLLRERLAEAGRILVIGAGGGLEIRYLAGVEPGWRFVGVDPAPAMLDLARATSGDVARGRLDLIHGTVADAPDGPFDAATCILVLGLVPDDGSKFDLLTQTRRRLGPGAPFILVDQCIDRSGPDFARKLDRYAAYARLSGVDDETVAAARTSVGNLQSAASASRNEQLLNEAGFRDADLFYVGLAWRGWVAYA